MRAIVLVCFVASCTPGMIESSGAGGATGGDGPDAGLGVGNGSGSGGGSGSGSGSASPFPCRNLVTTALSSGQHNAGQDCMQGCHNHGFTLSGTLYSAGGAALPGGSITVKDANGATFDMVAQQNGNFYTKQAIAFPITVYASSCPTSIPMSGSIASGNGGCNKSGCHATGAQGHVHL